MATMANYNIYLLHCIYLSHLAKVELSRCPHNKPYQ